MPRNRVNIIIALRDQFTKGLERARTSFQKFTKSVTGFGALLTGVIGASVLEFANRAGKASRDAEAAERKFNTVFKGVQSDVNEWAASYSKDFGLAESATKRLAGTLGDFLVPIGATRDQAFAMTRAVSEVAGAIALFDNTAPEQVFEDILSAFAGSSEVLLKYGTVVTETALKNSALELGFGKITGVLDPYTRSLLITNTLIESQRDALGQLTNTQRNNQAQINALNAALKSEQETLGEGVSILHVAIANLGTAAINTKNTVRDFISDVGNEVGRLIGQVNPAFAELRARNIAYSQSSDEAKDSMVELNEEAKKQEEEFAKLEAEIKALIEAQTKVYRETIKATEATKDSTKAAKEAADAVEESADAYERFEQSQSRSAETQKRYLQDLRSLREEQRRSRQAVPERIAEELDDIRTERANLQRDTSLSRKARQQGLQELLRREKAVNRVLQQQNITQQDIAEAQTRNNRTDFERDIENILERRIGLETKEVELRQRARNAEANALKQQIELLTKVRDLESSITSEVTNRGSRQSTSDLRGDLRSGRIRAPSLDAVFSRRDIRSERRV